MRTPRKERNLKFAHGKWYVDFTMTIGGKKKRFIRYGGMTRKAAELELARLRTEKDDLRKSIKAGAPVIEKKPDLTFSEFVEQKFKPAISLKPRRAKTAASHETSIKNLTAAFGEKPLSEISVEDVNQYIHDRKESKVRKHSKTGFKILKRCLSNASVNREITALKQILRLAVKYGYLQTSPAADAAKLPEPLNWTILTDSEAGALLEAVRPAVRPILQLLLKTGMRKSEALRLVWAFPDYGRKVYADDREARSVLDLKGELIHIPGQLSKNHKARTVPLSQGLRAMFQEISIGFKPGAPVFGVKDIKRAFQSACKAAKIPKLRIHDLRHTAASRMIEAGINVVDVCEMLGHSDLKITMRYCHSSLENKRRAVQALDDIYEESRKKVETSIPAPGAPIEAIPS